MVEYVDPGEVSVLNSVLMYQLNGLWFSWKYDAEAELQCQQSEKK
jgi:hypothetical protein